VGKKNVARSESGEPESPEVGRDRLEGVAGYLADDRAREFDRLVYERVRLGILSALAVNSSLTFSELKELLRTSDGNLSVHARKLEEASYIICTKFFKGRVPRTEYRLSTRGRKALERYLDHMEALIEATRS
jgi:DNA-binding transcriptional ArsR family regulator